MLLLLLLLLLLFQTELVVTLQTVRRLVILPGGYGGHPATIDVDVN